MFHPHHPPLPPPLSPKSTWDEAAVAVAVRIKHEGNVRLPNGTFHKGPSEHRRGLVRLGHDDESAGATVEAVYGMGEQQPCQINGRMKMTTTGNRWRRLT